MDYKNIEKKLRARLKQLEERVDEIEDDLSSSNDDDFEEMAVESRDDEILEAGAFNAEQEIEEIRNALELIKSGEYGKCRNCGNAIAEKRLEAIPHKSLCIDCA